MSKLSKEQFKRLEPLEVFLNQSRHDYLVNQSMANKEIVFEIHRKLFGGDIGKITCPTCVLRTYRRVADLYFEYKESKKEKKEEKEEIKEDSSTAQDIIRVQETTIEEKNAAAKNKSTAAKQTTQDKKKTIKK